ncbi:MAG: polyhydroxyalkanoate depolymerase, partial [Sandarakinorhabdus sp.]|nr:polyhydroxyalkanoate depolymerase [Sandarakinorhabdus sp.]
FVHRGVRIDPAAIDRTALLAIEGERDDISGLGQTKAALDLATGLDADKKQYYMAEGAGHYGIFNGRKWRESIAPIVERFIRKHDPATLTPLAVVTIVPHIEPRLVAGIEVA